MARRSSCHWRTLLSTHGILLQTAAFAPKLNFYEREREKKNTLFAGLYRAWSRGHRRIQFSSRIRRRRVAVRVIHSSGKGETSCDAQSRSGLPTNPFPRRTKIVFPSLNSSLVTKMRHQRRLQEHPKAGLATSSALNRLSQRRNRQRALSTADKLRFAYFFFLS